MASTLQKVVLVGGSGRLGPFILKALQADNFAVTVATRKSSAATFPPGTNVVRVSDEYLKDEMAGVFAGADAVVLCLGFGGTPRHPALVDASIEAGVKRLVASTFGGHDGNKAAEDVFPTAKKQHAMLDDMRSKERPGWSWSSINCGLFFDFCIQSGFFGFNAKARTATIWDGGDYHFSAATRATIGRSVAGVLRHPEETANRSVFISSFEVSMNEILSAYKKATGVEDWSVTHVDCGDMIKQGKEEWAQGNMMGMAKLALGSHLRSEYGANFAELGKLDNKLFGLGGEDVDQVVSRALQDAKP